MLRREFTFGAAVTLWPRAAVSATGDWRSLPARLAAIEAGSGGRLGVAVLDLGKNRVSGHRAAERFPMCSTFKALLAAQVLSAVDAGKMRLDQRLPVQATDIIAHSPITQARVGGDISVAELCEATVTLSDNAAANLLLAQLGGPKGLTAYLRGLGDRATRLDRTEPALNEGRPGDPRDTTTPRAMSLTWRALLFGRALSASSRSQLTAWLLANQTGGARLRAGLPDGWRVGDKTGSGPSTTNDVAVIWPTAGGPLILSAFLTESEADDAVRSRVLARVAQAVAAAL